MYAVILTAGLVNCVCCPRNSLSPELLPYLADLVRDWERDGSDSHSPIRLQAIELTGHMLASWPKHAPQARQSEPSDTARMLSLLCRLGDRVGGDRLLATLIAGGGHGKADTEAILGMLDLFSPDEAADRLAAIVTAGAAVAPAACSALLAGAVRGRFASRPAKLRDAAAILVGALPGKQAPPRDRFGWPVKVKIDADAIVDLVDLLDEVDASVAEGAARHLLAWPEHFGLDAVLVPAIRRLIETGAAADGTAFGILRRACLNHLEDRIAQPLEAPSDWSRPSEIKCKCEPCTALEQFLADPDKPRWALKAAEQIRGHVELRIRQAGSDLDTRTDRSGRPYSLVCTKNQASYERRVAQRRKDLDSLAALAR